LSISFVVVKDFQPIPPAAETFALVLADQTAFARLHPHSLTGFKNGTVGFLPGYNFGDPAIKSEAQALIQAALVGGGATVAAATLRAADIINQSCALRLVAAILADAGA
jgi:hypothetical protein